jgi:hypothetical protein
MALSKTVNSAYGINVTNAYHRVENLNLLKKDLMSFMIRSYVSADKPFFNEQTFYSAYDLSGENPITQAYQHVKALPEFAGATDC